MLASFRNDFSQTCLRGGKVSRECLPTQRPSLLARQAVVFQSANERLYFIHVFSPNALLKTLSKMSQALFINLLEGKNSYDGTIMGINQHNKKQPGLYRTA
jgi:hypothetical protein